MVRRLGGRGCPTGNRPEQRLLGCRQTLDRRAVRGREAASFVSGQLADPVQDRRQRLRERLRAEWIAGAEEEWRRRTGRSMTAAELGRVLRRYPGDV